MDHIPIRLNTLRPNSQIFFDVYIHIAGKHLHYIKKADIFDSARLENLKKKGVKKLFVRTDEEDNYLKYLDMCLTVLSDPNFKMNEKAIISYDALVTDAENAERNLETEQGYKAVRARVGKIIDFLGSEKGTLKSILDSAGVALDDHQHGANVASLSTALALRIGGISPREVGDLSLAALLHDIGKPKLGFTGSVDITKLDAQQKKDYKKHPEKGLEMLSAKKYVTPLILRLVAEHEELMDGKGYPERKNLGSLPITTQILSLCNHFDTYSMATQKPPTEAMKTFFQEKGELFDLEHVTKLGDLLVGK